MVRFAAAFAIAATLLAQSANGEELLLDFSTPYCGPCRQMEPTIQNFEKAGYPIRKVDATREPQLASEFNVTRFPTFLMLVDNQEVDRVVGFTSGERLQQMFAKAREVTLGRARGQSPDPAPPNSPRREPPNFAAGPASPAQGANWPPREGWSGSNSDAAAPQDRPAEPSASEFAANLLNATVRLKVDDGKFRSFGTGTIIDTRSGEALIVTCGHLFRETKGKSPVNVELFEATPDGVRVAGQLTGQVISYDLDRDIALVSVRPGRPVQMARVAPPDCVIDRGDRVVTIGCSNGDDPTALPSRVTDLNRYLGPPNIEASGAPAEGRSGGGMFNTEGQLIGVCTNADYDGNEGLYAALESVQGELDRLNLSDVYAAAGSGEKLAPNSTASTQAGAGDGRIVRGQDDAPPPATLSPHGEFDPPRNPAPSTIGERAPLPQGLKPAEQAAFEEIITRAATHEVVCIVRPNEPGGESEIITLNGVSAEFVQALAERQRDAAAATRTR